MRKSGKAGKRESGKMKPGEFPDFAIFRFSAFFVYARSAATAT